MTAVVKRIGTTAAALCVALVAPTPALGQASAQADSLLAAGDLVRAESAYYAGARNRPRDPPARAALGRFLIARGATRVGATLLEEALQFGGDPVVVGRELVGAYLQMADFAPLAASPAASPAQRERAKWLTTHDPRVVAPDSVITLAIAPNDDAASLGNVAIRVNGVTLVASVSAGARGIAVSRSALGNRPLPLFAAGADTTGDSDFLAVADSVSIGSLTMLNQPVTAARLPSGAQARIGLSDLGRFAPSGDASSATLTLHLDGSVHEQVPGDRLPTLDRPTGISVLRSGVWLATPADVATLLRSGRWTFDARRGTLIVER